MSLTPSAAAITDAVRRAMPPSSTPSAPPSLGRAYLASAEYRLLRTSGWLHRAGPPPMEARGTEGVLSVRELISALRLRSFADLNPFSIDPKTGVSALAQPSLLPGLVETIPTTRNQVELASELTESPVASSVDDGTALPEPALAFNPTPNLAQLKRFGAAWPVTKALLDSAGEVEAFLDERLLLSVGVGLEAGILSGNTSAMTGILNTPGVGVITKGDAAHATEYDLDAILRAVAAVHDQGWYTNPNGLAAIIHPDTLRLVREQRNSAGAYLWNAENLASVGSWSPSRFMPAGQALVGDPFAGVALYLKQPDGLSVEMSASHQDFLTRDEVMMATYMRCYCWVRRPDAFALVSGLGA